tara:strand:- start:164 stop:445 length:282 start_codon:yes stop_codon:yes gene_type:complete
MTKIKNTPLNKTWELRTVKHLVGAKIIQVEYMPKDEVEHMMFENSPICLLLEDSKGKRFWIYPTADDEGNDGGAMFTSIQNYPVIPVISKYDL